ncbi:hypothetical protein QMK38_20070, partial [Lysinibacillus fusiformis]|nr:hypothetical protein [Lysinibacillus fusiformis]
VEITASGKSSIDSDDKYANHLVFDCKNAVIDSNLVINGDYINLKNMTVKGNLVLREAVKSSFYLDNVKIEKKTIVSDNVQVASVQSNSLYNSLSFQTVASLSTVGFSSPNASIIFNNSKLGALEINKPNAMVEVIGKTEASSVSINSRVKFSADAATIIPKITIEAGVESVEINSNVEDVLIIGNGSITITGNGNFGHMIASVASIVTVNSSGKIGLLKTIDKDSKFILGKDTKISDLQLPAGVDPKTAIPNYDNVIVNIQNIGGKENPDFIPGKVVSQPSAGPSIPTNRPPVV